MDGIVPLVAVRILLPQVKLRLLRRRRHGKARVEWLRRYSTKGWIVCSRMTFPQKTRPLAWKFFCAEMGATGGCHDTKRHTEDQIIAFPKDAQAGIGGPGCHLLYAGLEMSDVKRLRQLNDENRRLKQMVADQALDIQALKTINLKNWQGPRRSERQVSGAPSALGSVSYGCVASGGSIARRSGIAVAAKRMSRRGRGFGDC